MATPRDLAHAEQRQRIIAVARDHLIREGAAQLSLRKVIKEVGMVSSAIYRYFPNRDALLTALIVEGYQNLARDLGEVTAPEPEVRFRELCARLIAWGRAHPQVFALIYGSPVSGYAAPADTIEPAARVVAPFLEAVAAGESAGDLATHSVESEALAAQAADLVAASGVTLTPGAAVGAVEAFTLLVGALTLHLGGHFIGTFDPFEPLADRLVATAARLAGWRLPRQGQMRAEALEAAQDPDDLDESKAVLGDMASLRAR